MTIVELLAENHQKAYNAPLYILGFSFVLALFFAWARSRRMKNEKSFLLNQIKLLHKGLNVIVDGVHHKGENFNFMIGSMKYNLDEKNCNRPYFSIVLKNKLTKRYYLASFKGDFNFYLKFNESTFSEVSFSKIKCLEIREAMDLISKDADLYKSEFGSLEHDAWFAFPFSIPIQ